jgi:hypothetical protein
LDPSKVGDSKRISKAGIEALSKDCNMSFVPRLDQPECICTECTKELYNIRHEMALHFADYDAIKDLKEVAGAPTYLVSKEWFNSIVF